MEENSLNPNRNEYSEALRKAQLLLKNKGYVEFDQIFTNAKEANAGFGQVVGGQILNWLGHQFFWRRPPSEDLILFARNTGKEELKDLGLIEICRMKRIPEEWVGVGRFIIDWPHRKKGDDTPLLFISLYLFSIDLDDLDHLLSNGEEDTAYLATIFLDEENVSLFYELAEERYDSLQ